MASPQKEKGYTPIANELLEAFLQYKFPKNTGDTPFLLWLFIARKTYGFSKKKDVISLSQFEKGTNCRRGTIVHWLNYLVQANVLVRANVPTKTGFVYAINKDYDTWKPLVQARRLVQARNISSTLASTKTSTLARTHINKKQYIQKKGDFVPPSLPDTANFIQQGGYNVDAEQWLNFYESKGWMIGKNKMKDWKAAVRTWAKRSESLPKKETDPILIEVERLLKKRNDVGQAMIDFDTKYGSEMLNKYLAYFPL